LVPYRHEQMAKHPTHRGVPIDDICAKYGATDFISALSWFIVQYQHLDYSKAQVQALSESIHVSFSKISVFHCLKIFSYDAYSLNPLDEVVTNSIQVYPAHFDKYGKVVPGRFDTAIIQIREAHDLDLKGTSVMINSSSSPIYLFY
jgi:hypothetical protein